MTNALRIIGLDPGLRRTGWGVIACAGSRLSLVAHGVVAIPDALPMAERLHRLLEAICEVVALHDPHEAAVEEVFVNANPASTLKLGQARACALVAPARHGLPVAEYATRLVKKAVVGTGAADKDQVGFMVRRLLPGVGEAGHDACDALAVAIAHAHLRVAAARLKGARVIGRLRGTLAEVEADHAVIDVGGVGYIVRMGAHALGRLPEVGAELVVQVESRFTAEGGTTLYGFLGRDERTAFNALTAIQGVGPKAGLSVLDILPPAELAAAVAREDKASVGRANGVGPKLALRIVTELKGKPLGAGALTTDFAPSPTAAAPPAPSLNGEATAALMGLGLAEPLARRAVEAASARLGAGADLPALIKAALQETAR